MESNALCHHMKIDNKASENQTLSPALCVWVRFINTFVSFMFKMYQILQKYPTHPSI